MRKLIVSIGTAVVLFGITSPALAQQGGQDEPECDPQAEVFYEPNTKLKDTWTTQGNDFIIKIYITTDDDNTARLCEPEQFVLSSWNTEGGDPPPTDTQTMVGVDKLNTRDAGTYVLRVPIPECAWQVDFAPGLTPGIGNDLAYSWGDGPKSCQEPEPEPTDEPNPPNHNNNNNHHDKPKPEIGTAIHGHGDRHGKHNRYGGTAMTGLNDNQKALAGAMFAFLVVGGLSLIAARKRERNN